MATTTGNYTGQYSTQIQKLMSEIENYGKFNYSGQSTYKQLLDSLLGYGDFNYGNQGAYDAALDKATNYGPFSYDKQGDYEAILQKVLNPEAFSYDPTTDEQWSSYKKAYTREGDRAAQNALVQASIATGGVPSSYAVTAAQQAQNYYNSQMADMIPTLAQNAYQRYLNDYDKLLSGLSALTTDRNSAYSLWQDGYTMAQQALANLQSDRDSAYQKYLDGYSKLQSDLGAVQADREQEQTDWSDYLSVLQNALGNYQSQDATEYQRQQAAVELQRQQEQEEYQKQQNAYSNLLTLITTTGYVPDAATLAAAGMSAEEAAAWKAYYDAANTSQVSADYVASQPDAVTEPTTTVEETAGGGGIDYAQFTDTDWDAYFSMLPADQVNATANWLQNTYGISPHTLNKFVAKYGLSKQTTTQQSSAASSSGGKSTGGNMANMLR